MVYYAAARKHSSHMKVSKIHVQFGASLTCKHKSTCQQFRQVYVLI